MSVELEHDAAQRVADSLRVLLEVDRFLELDDFVGAARLLSSIDKLDTRGLHVLLETALFQDKLATEADLSRIGARARTPGRRADSSPGPAVARERRAPVIPIALARSIRESA